MGEIDILWLGARMLVAVVAVWDHERPLAIERCDCIGNLFDIPDSISVIPSGIILIISVGLQSPEGSRDFRVARVVA